MKYKIILSIIFLFLNLFIVSKVNATSPVPSLSFNPSDTTLGIGQEVSSDIIIDTAGYNVGGAGVIIKFDPTIVTVKSVERGTAFVDYPLVFFDNTLGEIRLSGVVSGKDSLFTGVGVMGKVIWKGVSLGRTYATFDFTRGSTKDSNIAVLTGSGDVLEQVSYLTLIVQTQAAPVVVPSIPEAQNLPAPAPETFKELPFVGRVFQLLGISTSNNDPDGPIKNQVPNNIKSIKQPVVTNIDSNTTSLIKVIAIMFSCVVGTIIIIFLIIWVIKKLKRKNDPPSDPTGTHLEAQL